MKVTEVIFKRNYAISPLTHEHMHLGATVVVEENESPEDALKLAQKTVEDFYSEAMKQVHTGFMPSNYPNFLNDQTELPDIDYKKIEQEEIDKENKLRSFLENTNPFN